MTEILLYQEAEEFVRSLQSFDIYNVGSREWHAQHTRLVKLNMQTHQNMMFNREDYVADLMNTYRKWDVIISDLICIHLFKIHVFPAIVANLKQRHTDEPIRPDLEPCMAHFLYDLLFHEVVLAEFLASTCLDKLPEAEHLDDLVDWCVYHITNLISKKFTRLPCAGKDNSEKKSKLDPRFPTSELSVAVSQGLRDRLKQQAQGSSKSMLEIAQHLENNILGFFDQLVENDVSINYNTSLTVLSLLRGLLFHKFPISLQSKLKATRISVLVAQLLTKNVAALYGNIAPWQRMLNDRSLEYWDGTSWCKYATNEESNYKLTVMEAQVWLILLEARANIPDQFTQNELSVFDSIKGRLNETLVSQLPELKEYRLYLEQLILQGAQQEANSVLAKQQQKIREQYGLADDFTLASDAQLYSPGAILVQTANYYESELTLKVRYWYQMHTKAHTKGEAAKTGPTFITDMTDKEEESIGTSVTSFEALSQVIKQAMYDALAEEYVRLMGTLRVEDIADTSSTGMYLDHYSSVFPVCANCGVLARNRCSRCHNVWYCGRKCQKIDWVAGHSKVCKRQDIPKSDIIMRKKEETEQKKGIEGNPECVEEEQINPFDQPD
ncbi:Putative MYND finger domain protein [Giardia duodenalis]|uniref:Putative MYND finger domain protein n=1 Tax=Giardia intestinalis TaxID=5741 RepID=V6TLV9_GIAIN|nr:Putative MYND finger domain protein [Giardia intestinalis]